MTPQPASLGSILSMALQSTSAQQGWLAETARFHSAQVLAADVAGELGEDQGKVWDSLTLIPDNMLSLLDHPQGWSALAAYLADDLRRAPTGYAPTVH
ncbi:hypothetical protein [Qipengyuania huizhouensis]|uniref:hypothetical protein n=1 Tax=Qipengyuania huizhouensis TaxID=2867245 RepID=UPI001C87154D|nr:hypothetical protein [Qipengyuania huizhouensis]MBX7461778.1 hypothetical protein [Qipengyuania huizhouensis]